MEIASLLTKEEYMKFIVGNLVEPNGRETNEPLIVDTSVTINPHGLILGQSGVGKTHTIRKIISSSLSNEGAPVRIHLYDVHDDIAVDENFCSSVQYSEISHYGINPLQLNPDKHAGGVRKRIASFIATLEKATAKLGAKQAGILRSLMLELYQSKGFQANNSDTWSIDNDKITLKSGCIYLDVPFAEKDVAKQMGASWDAFAKSWYIPEDKYIGEVAEKFDSKDISDFDMSKNESFQRRYPSLDDLVKYLGAKREEVFVGAGSETIKALQEFHKSTRSYNAKVVKYGNAAIMTDEEIESIESAASKCKEALSNYLASYGTEKTLKQALNYGTADVLNSLYQRLGVLNSSGVFKNTPPPFDKDKIVHRHRIKSLGADEQKLFVLFSLEQIFERMVQEGPSKEIREVVILDEAHKFFDDDPSSILNIIAREARKFGLALYCASQSPSHFSDDFLSSVATKMVLGIDEMYWPSANKKLRIGVEQLKAIKPRETFLVQTKILSESNGWQAVKA